MQKRFNRRNFLKATSLVLGSGVVGAVGSSCDADFEVSRVSALADLSDSTEGPLTLYYEFRIAPPEVEQMNRAVENLGRSLAKQEGFIGYSLKEMTGESTMVKNYPENYKGMLNEAVLDGVRQKSLPHFYALFIRFRDASNMKSHMDSWFVNSIEPLLHVYAPAKGKTPMRFRYHEGVYYTVVAGNRGVTFRTPSEKINYMQKPADEPERGLVTVGNQVTIEAKNTELFEKRIRQLLDTAQNTYRPAERTTEGLPGKPHNRHYKRAVTTEILASVHTDGGLRNYIMHGTWESYWDHENSHLDHRFKEASMPVGVLVVDGPVEPFYLTRKLFIA